jgi:hypothetical protein
VPFILMLFFSSVVFAQIKGEIPALTPFASERGTYLVAMPTYTYSRAPGTLGLNADEETWQPDKWKNRQILGRFVPIMDWETKTPGIWFYTGNELGDMLWQELATTSEESNRTPMLYGGFTVQPFASGFYASGEFNQIDHFSAATKDVRQERLHGSQKFSWFGDNLPAYSGLSSEIGYNNSGAFFKKASSLFGSEYVWGWNKEEWVPIRINRLETNLGFYFMEKEIELNASTEKFQIQDSAAEFRNNLGFRLKGKNTGGGFYAHKTKDKEDIVVWSDFNHSFFQALINKGFVAFNSNQNLMFADSLEYHISINKSSALIPGVLINQNGVKLYGETSYKFKPIFAKTKAYQNYTSDFESIGFDTEIAYVSNVAGAGVAYSKEFFEYYREQIYYEIKAVESSAKIFLQYRFLENLFLTHELVYRDAPSTWFWNAQIEQQIPKLNTSLYAILLHVLSKETKDFSFGGINGTRFFCGINLSF